MNPYDYDDNFSNDEYGKQLWNEYLEEDDTTESVAQDSDHIHLSSQAEEDLLKFAKEKSRTSKKVNKSQLFIIGIVVGLCVAIPVAGYSIFSARNSYIYEDYDYYIDDDDLDYYYDFENDLGMPEFYLDGVSYQLPMNMEEFLEESGAKIRYTSASEVGSEPATALIYDSSNSEIGEFTLISPYSDGTMVPIEEAVISGITITNTSETWLELPFGISLYSSSYAIDEGLEYASGTWTKTGSGDSYKYEITNPISDTSQYHLTLQMEDSEIISISMQIEQTE